MSHERASELGTILWATITGVSIGTFVFQALGTLLLGIIGALGGYLFNKFAKPRLDKFFKKKS
jgi:hypothetical protein